MAKSPKPQKTAAEKKVDAYEKERPQALSFTSHFTEGEIMRIANPRSKATYEEVSAELSKRGSDGPGIVDEWKEAEKQVYRDREKHPEEFDDED